VQPGESIPRGGEPLFQGPCHRAGLRVEDKDGDRSHLPSVWLIGGAAIPRRIADGRVEVRMAQRRVRAYVGLGANLGDAASTLRAAIHALAALPAGRLVAVSRLYATDPVGVIDQPEFRNAVVALDVPAGPDPGTGATALLIALKALEAAFGRQARRRWGPRELDLDLLVFGRARLAIDRPVAGRSIDADIDPAKATRLLEVPHPAVAKRLFVLAPLADLAEGLVPPGWHESVGTARRRREIAEGSTAVRPIATWDLAAGSWRPIDPPDPPPATG